MKGLSGEKKTHRYRKQYGDYQREREVEEYKGGINADRRLTLGGKCRIQYTDDVL